MKEVCLFGTKEEITVFDFHHGNKLSTIKEGGEYFHLLPDTESNGTGFILSFREKKETLCLLTWLNIIKKKFLGKEITAVSGSRKYGIVGFADGEIIAWCLKTGKISLSEKLHVGAITRFSFSSDETILLSAGTDAKVIAWDTSFFEQENSQDSFYMEWTSNTFPIKDLYVGIGLRESARFLTASENGTCFLFNMIEKEPLAVFHFESVNSITMDSLERFIAVGCKNGDVLISSTENIENELFRLNIHTDIVTSVSFSVDNTLLISASLDGSINVSSVTEKDIVFSFKGNSPIYCLQLTFYQYKDINRKTPFLLSENM